MTHSLCAFDENVITQTIFVLREINVFTYDRGFKMPFLISPQGYMIPLVYLATFLHIYYASHWFQMAYMYISIYQAWEQKIVWDNVVANSYMENSSGTSSITKSAIGPMACETIFFEGVV